MLDRSGLGRKKEKWRSMGGGEMWDSSQNNSYSEITTDEERNWLLLSLYLDGEADESERAEAESLLKSEERWANELALMRRSSHIMNAAPEIAPPPTMHSSILAATTQRVTMRSRMQSLWILLRRPALASASLAAIALFFLFQQTHVATILPQSTLTHADRHNTIVIYNSKTALPVETGANRAGSRLTNAPNIATRLQKSSEIASLSGSGARPSFHADGSSKKQSVALFHASFVRRTNSPSINSSNQHENQTHAYVSLPGMDNINQPNLNSSQNTHGSDIVAAATEKQTVQSAVVELKRTTANDPKAPAQVADAALPNTSVKSYLAPQPPDTSRFFHLRSPALKQPNAKELEARTNMEWNSNRQSEIRVAVFQSRF